MSTVIVRNRPPYYLTKSFVFLQSSEVASGYSKMGDTVPAKPAIVAPAKAIETATVRQIPLAEPVTTATLSSKGKELKCESECNAEEAVLDPMTTALMPSNERRSIG